ncbi:MAG TPA: FtsX-like permease family protein [Polyangia bacterium]|nr:FtsX-like permease family protein [Polyangia bacterium]
MTLLGVATRNLLRNKFRTLATITGVAIAVFFFMMLRTALAAWTAGADHAAKDRVVTRNKVTLILPLPLRYVEEIRQVPGVKESTYLTFFAGKDPKHSKDEEFFATMAVDHKTFLHVYDDLVVDKAAQERWFEDRRGVIVGDVLAKNFGWKVGQRINLTGTIYPGDWEFTISGIYTVKTKSIDRRSFFFRWDYLNDSLPPRRRDLVGWVVSRVDDAPRSAAIGQAIDRTLDVQETQTLSQSERAFSTSFLSMLSSVLKAMDVVSLVMLAIMMLILGNTIAMGVRERTNEYGVLRAIGFLPRHIVALVVGEATVTGLLGGLVGASLFYLAAKGVMGRFIEENFGQFFPSFDVTPGIATAALTLSVVLGLLAGLVPAYGTFKLNIVQALRRVG